MLRLVANNCLHNSNGIHPLFIYEIKLYLNVSPEELFWKIQSVFIYGDKSLTGAFENLVTQSSGVERGKIN